MGNFTKAHAQWWDSNAKETERVDSKRKKAIMGKLGLPTRSEDTPLSEKEKKQAMNDLGLPYKKQPVEREPSYQTKKRILDKLGLPSESEEEVTNKPLSGQSKKRVLGKLGLR